MYQILSLNLTNGGKIALVVTDPSKIEIDEMHNDIMDAVRVTVTTGLPSPGQRVFVVSDTYDALTDRLLEMCRKHNFAHGLTEKP